MIKFIYTYLYVLFRRDVLINGKLVLVSAHAAKQAEDRGIVFPDHVYNVLKTGKIKRFGKKHMKIIKRSRKGSVICVGIDVGDTIIIKTITRGN